MECKEYIRNHRLCMMLALKYLKNIAQEAASKEGYNGAFIDTNELAKYQSIDYVGENYNGNTWIQWFVNDFMPRYLEEEEKHVETR